MEKLVRRITNIAVITLTSVTGLFGLYVMFNGDKFHVGGQNPITLVKNPIAMDTTFYLMYLMFFIGIALILGFGIMQIISNKKQIIKTLAIAVIAVVVYWVCYLIAPAELSETAMKVGITEDAYKLVGGMLNVVYAMFAGVLLTFLGMKVYTKIKNR